MTVLLGIGAALGCGLGAVLRYLISRIPHGHFPWTTMVANAAGSLLLGILAHTLASGNETAYLILATGVAGGLTTFSSLAVDALVLWKDQHRAQAVLYLVITGALGVAAAAVGWWLAEGLG
jgi:CrcB protein